MSAVPAQTGRRVAAMPRPQRWDTPFDGRMTDAIVQALMRRDEFASIDRARFPAAIPLEGILRNDCRIVECAAGDIVIREGDYGNSAYVVLEGELLAVVRPDLPQHLLGRKAMQRRGLLAALAQLWTNDRRPEVRNTDAYAAPEVRQGARGPERVSLLSQKGVEEIFTEPNRMQWPRDQVPQLRAEYTTVKLQPGSVFGEIAALGRVQRKASVYAQRPSRLLEIRWQGLRELRKYDEGWRKLIDTSYRENQLKRSLQQHAMLRHLGEDALQELADGTLFETYGSFEWFQAFRKRQTAVEDADADEFVIAREGDYADGLLLVSAGFARVSIGMGNGRRTLTYLKEGDYFGLDELYTGWKSGHALPLETTLSALGYLDVLRVPLQVLERLVFPHIEPPVERLADFAARPLASDALLEWAVDQRFINGTQTMLINTDLCVRCDDCVRACASTHGGNPRFVRHGRTHGQYMVANACMHCTDPVCMIGCPTGAIHRSQEGGTVVINDQTCIGCGTCANSCPYENIRLVEISDTEGRPVLDPATQMPIMKATKCDLCSEQPTGPACVRACPHGALERVDFRERSIFARAGEA